MFYFIFYFSRVLCNSLSLYLICNPQHPLDTPTPPVGPLMPHPKYRHLVIKSGTTAGQHDMSSASWSVPTPGRCIWWPRVVLTEVWFTRTNVLLSAIYDLDFARVLWNTLSQFLICSPPMPPLTPLHPLSAQDPHPRLMFCQMYPH